MASTHRRRTGRTVKLSAAIVAAAAIAGGAVALAGSASAATVGAAYSKTSDWSTGYTGQYVITNSTGSTLDGWTLTFDLPAGTSISSLWNGDYTVSGQTVTVKPAGWNAKIAPGATVEVGFVTKASAKAADPVHCMIDNAKCSVDDGPTPTPTGRPTQTATPTPPPATSPAQPTQQPTGTPAPTPTGSTGTGSGSSASGGFSPYVDTSLYPAYDLTGAMKADGVKQFNLAFVTAGGGCTPKWGGVSDLGGDAVAAQIGAVRSAGGDVRVSFGGANGTELAAACSSATDLAAAYGKVVDQYKLTKVDFDIEGAALPDAAANTRRAQAVAQLQKSHSGLEVSFTLPAMPTGLTQDGINLLSSAKSNGVAIHAVNIMAMDYGSSFTGDMGQYAIDGATATQAQVKSVLGISDADAWKKIAVTPMIGVNDVSTETFTVADARELADFAASEHLAWLSMWSATRDKQCDGGAQTWASATCSSVTQGAGDFARAFNAYTG
ncbi:cellulose binding domain-containing protein [Actinacidiphila sp. DG2A-62]|uniref:glycoside hydrolase family 18 protein n=1 Tax=Actinacidiphila sp. DG2A-62 TaxID=3108821 RepID=UPI002DB809CE|nr:cellulose binding domain-containing protein [Actinacidiphila sp. DG2A-62]MEC3994340.1 cellulose binding domain-containing protein [Actinacidiphila sp. DG2A-62]